MFSSPAKIVVHSISANGLSNCYRNQQNLDVAKNPRPLSGETLADVSPASADIMSCPLTRHALVLQFRLFASFRSRARGKLLCQEARAVVPDIRQITSQNIYYLWQRINTGPAKKPLHPRHPLPAVRRGAEPERLNPPTVVANTNSAAQHRTAAIGLKSECDRGY